MVNARFWIINTGRWMLKFELQQHHLDHCQSKLKRKNEIMSYIICPLTPKFQYKLLIARPDIFW